MGCVLMTKRVVNGVNQTAVATLTNDTLAVFSGKINACKTIVEALETVDNSDWGASDLNIISSQIINDDSVNSVQLKGNAILTVKNLSSADIGKTIVINVNNFSKSDFKSKFQSVINSLTNSEDYSTDEFLITNAIIEVF